MLRSATALTNMAKGTMRDPQTRSFLIQVAYLGISLISSGMFLKWAVAQMDPAKESKARKKLMRRLLQERLGRHVDTDDYEDVIAAEVVIPQNIDVSLADIGGLEDVKNDLVASVIQPIKHPEMYRTYLLQQAKGVLLYGPPGTGKTMLAKALAKEAGCSFINISASTLTSKWYGETQKLTNALFTLAAKLEPCIIFIDEVDSLLGKRRDHEHEATTSMKTEFMQLWDGFSTCQTANVLVLAATNRPYDLDEAVLRRFAQKLEVGKPNARQREAILKLYLKRQAKESKNRPGSIYVEKSLLENTPSEPEGRRPQARLAEQTEGLSGSDLLELCRRAAKLVVQEHHDELIEQRRSFRRLSSQDNVCMELRHFTQVLRSFQPATQEAESYRLRAEPSQNGLSAQQTAAFLGDLLGGVYSHRSE